MEAEAPVKFHLAHIVPHESMHGMHGYKEVIDSVAWGLVQLGHEVTYGLNKATSDTRNIIFGAQVLSAETLAQLRPDSIVYNFEQIRNLRPSQLRREIRAVADLFEIWDYSPFNLETWEGLGTRLPVKTVPVGYAPVLERIPRAEQDIDALLYGLPNDLRLSAFNDLARSGIKTVFVSGLYGAGRDGLIARSRTVLNLSLYTNSKIFEIVRVSYLMANRKAVVATLDADTVIEPGLADGFKATRLETIVDDVRALVGDEKARRALEERGYAAFRKRDVRAYLAQALG